MARNLALRSIKWGVAVCEGFDPGGKTVEADGDTLWTRATFVRNRLELVVRCTIIGDPTAVVLRMNAYEGLIADWHQFDKTFVQPTLQSGVRSQARDLRLHDVVLRN